MEAHAAGEEGRVILGGVLDLPGDSVLEKMRNLEADGDDLRLRMLREPRGYPVTCCNLVVPASDPRAAAGFIVMQQTEYPPMSGSNAMCVASVLLKTGAIAATEPFTEFVLEAPAGLVQVRAEIREGRVGEIAIRNQPAFVVALDRPLEVPGHGTITVDVAYGGMMFVSCEARQLGFELRPDEARDLVEAGQRLKVAANEQIEVSHPENPGLTSITISQLWGPTESSDADLRSAVVLSSGLPSPADPYGGGILDRSPCGTGTCAKVAIQHARGQLSPGQALVMEGMLGTTFTGRLLEETTVGTTPAIVPEIAGRAWITGFTSYCLEDDDPFPEGFTLGDIWGP